MHVTDELQEFTFNLESEVTERVHENILNQDAASFRELVFTELVSNYLVEFGASEDVEICFLDKAYGRGKMHVNAYCVNDDAKRVVLVTTIYYPESMTTVHTKDIELAIQRAVRVFEAATKDFHSQMEPATDSFSMMQRLAEVSSETLDLQILVLTNGVAASNIEEVPLPDLSPSVRWQVWDIIRLSRVMASGKSYESIKIDLTKMPTGPLPCLKMPESDADYDAYMTIIPGDLLYRLYDEYGSKLLELNVRSFLQARGKVNRGIRDTIRHEPERFLAYNNGISATVENITVANGNNGNLIITGLEGFQIVNGGQTMASIHRARKVDKADLDSVFVQAKITVIDPDRINEIVPKISRYANTQNKVNEADFSANDPFHIEIERLSQKVWCPGEQSRWFYERARGQYQELRARIGTTPARRRKFDETTPRSQKFDKTSLAKYVGSWNQIPHFVSRGNQKNFVYFMSELRKLGQEWTPDEHYYRNLIAIGIISKKAEKIARQHKFPAYRANAITYTVSLISYRTLGRVDLDWIWMNQEVSDAMADTMYDLMPLIWQEIIDSAGERNVTEWCKKEECWRTIQTLEFEIPQELQDELAEGSPLPTVGSRKGQKGVGLTNEDRENIAKTMQLTVEDLLKLHKWATESDKHFSLPGIVHTLSGYANTGWHKVPSAKQAKQAVKLLSEATADGVFEEE